MALAIILFHSLILINFSSYIDLSLIFFFNVSIIVKPPLLLNIVVKLFLYVGIQPQILNYLSSSVCMYI